MWDPGTTKKLKIREKLRNLNTVWTLLNSVSISIH